MKKTISIFPGLLFTFSLFAQQTEMKEAGSLADFLKQGDFSGKARFYFMHSNNQEPLSDYHGLGIGGGIGYKTPQYKGFSAGLSGYFIINAYSSDFTQSDSVTQNPNRYELGLFDVTDPSNKENMYRLEELWVNYQKKDLNLTYGQFKPDYLFVNPQDGRMSPTMVRGFDGVFDNKKTSFQLAWLHHIAPRSTVKWYSVEETFGIYPTGRATDGSASSYLWNVESSGILIAEANQKIGQKSSAKLGLMNVNKVYTTSYAQLDVKKNNWGLSGLAIYQKANAEGLNSTYIDPDHQSLIFSGRLEKKLKKSKVNLNYTRIADQGRFLMPREWGREPLFTFLPRERNEGLADVNAISANYIYKPNNNTILHAGAGNYWLPDADDAQRNKYAMPSYAQLNLDAEYNWDGWFEGGSLKLLYVYKKGQKDDYENLKQVFNKVNVHLVNLIFNYTF